MNYRGFLTMFSAAILALVILGPAFAQDYGYEGHGDRDWAPADSGGYDQGTADRWERFLHRDENSNFARMFHGNPNIVRDPREMDQWTGVREFFDRHPEVREYVFHQVRDYNQNTRPGEKWRRELDVNPNFADRFHQNPDIVNDPRLASEEPEIGAFLRTNPDVRDYLERHNGNYGGNYGHGEDGYNGYRND